MYLMWILLMPTFVLSEIDNPRKVFSTVSSTPSPSDQETNHILTQLQALRSDFLELLKSVNNRTCQERYEANLFSRMERTIEDKITAQNKHLEQVKREVALQNKQLEQLKSEQASQNIEQLKSEVVSQKQHLEQLKSEVVKLANELEKMNDSLKKMNNTETAQKVETYPEDCREIQKVGSVSGVYKIKPKLSPEPFDVLCEMDTQGGGWVYVMNRFDGSQNFYLYWKNYKNGFGKLTGEFWLGLNHLYELTNSRNSELLIELGDWDGESVYALYKNFSVGNEQESFKIKVLAGFTGNTTDMMAPHVNYNFITRDRDDDNNIAMIRGPWWYHPSYSAKLIIGEPWWYHSSYNAKLTGVYFEREKGVYGTGIHWGTFHGHNYCLKKAKMLIRPY